MLGMVQVGLRAREPRTKVIVPCRLNHGGRWSDACIHNVSSRGMLVAADDTPAAGTYIEIRRGTLTLIGRVAWSQQRFCGVRTQDRLDIRALVNEPRRTQAPDRKESEPASDRRATSRLAAEGRLARRVEQSRQQSSTLQFAIMLGVGGVAALILASEVSDVLDRPFAAIEVAMGGHPAP